MDDHATPCPINAPVATDSGTCRSCAIHTFAVDEQFAGRRAAHTSIRTQNSVTGARTLISASESSAFCTYAAAIGTLPVRASFRGRCSVATSACSLRSADGAFAAGRTYLFCTAS